MEIRSTDIGDFVPLKAALGASWNGLGKAVYTETPNLVIVWPEIPCVNLLQPILELPVNTWRAGFRAGVS